MQKIIIKDEIIFLKSLKTFDLRGLPSFFFAGLFQVSELKRRELFLKYLQLHLFSLLI